MKRCDMRFEVIVPCSTANLGPGFDSVGMALDRFLRLSFSPADQLHVETVGENLEGVSSGEDNLVIRVMKKAFALQGLSLPAFSLRMKSEIPLTKGLGSSAAAIVGGLVAANHLLGSPWDRDDLLQMAMEWEGHPDNVGASLYGGVVVGTWDGERAYLISGEPPDLPVVAAIPNQPLSTRRAREVLPDSYSRAEAVLSSSRSNLLVAALFTRRFDLLKAAMRDAFHQPYREALVPGLKEVLSDACDQGALGVALSGAGPTIIAFASEKERIQAYFREKFRELGVSVEIVELKACRKGAYIRLTSESNHSKFVGNAKGVGV
ncbi:homoserine kinase [Lihuaxuella thermophila]|uniref:Homoserine kinase n=1 Tax=Lihuaxuella thermophila TaxID=1173111 RepID=A0A1H8FSG9_9BACL|nr:homoserine kinase [Lihuaxuella thermophila]SEN34741.1 homoserine kinase [Lihuaxuella thermophila]